MNYSLNIEPMFLELDFYDRIYAAKEAGFDNIEFWFWHDKDLEKLKEACRKADVGISGFLGDWNWSMCDRTQTKAYLVWLKRSMETAKFLGCRSLILHSNHINEQGSSDFREIYSPQAHLANMSCMLMEAAPMAEAEDITLCLEPLSNLGNDAGIFLTGIETAAEVIRALGSPNIRLLCDFYHEQRMHGDLLSRMLKNLDILNYVHIADAPGRKEPGTGELNCEYILSALMEHGFEGWFCFEMFPENMDAALQAAAQLRSRIPANGKRAIG